jgi:hypothetical protein
VQLVVVILQARHAAYFMVKLDLRPNTVTYAFSRRKPDRHDLIYDNDTISTTEKTLNIHEPIPAEFGNFK